MPICLRRSLDDCATAAPSQPRYGRQQGSDEEGWRVRHGDLMVKLQRDAREVSQSQAPPCLAWALPSDRLGRLEQLLHAQGWAYLHARVRYLRPTVAEPVRRACWHAKGLARTHLDCAPPKRANAEAHPPADHCKTLFLGRVNVSRWHMRARRKIQIEDQQLARGLVATHANHDTLTTDGIDDYLSFHWKIAQDGAGR
jgi:hypothetical protein